MEELKIVQIGLKEFQTTKIKTTFSEDKEIEIMQLLRENSDIFA